MASIFDDLAQNTFDPEYEYAYDPDAPERDEAPRASGDVEAKRQTLQRLVQPTKDPLTRLGEGAAADVRDLASSATALFGMAKSMVTHPISAAETVRHAALHPLDTLGTIAKGFTEQYAPEAGESVPGMLMRRALDHPVATLMDASALLGLPGGALTKAGTLTRSARMADVGAKLTEMGRYLDPIDRALQAGTYVMKTKAPGAAAYFKTQSILADETGARAKATRFLDQQRQQQLDEVFKGLNDAEKAVFFPYVEGRTKIDDAMHLTELTSAGSVQPREGAVRKLALDAAAERYFPIMEEHTRALGLDPVQAGEDAVQSWIHENQKNPDFNPFEPFQMQAAEATRKAAYSRAEEALHNRITVSTRTALDVAKEKAWRGEVENIKFKNMEARLKADEELLPKPPPTTVAEAYEQMGPEGGLIFPHSGEVLTRDQSTIRNVLHKVGEARAYMHNSGALFRSGALDHLDPVAALMRSYRTLVKGETFSDIADKVGQAVGVRLSPEEAAKFGTHPEYRAGTHQLLTPGQLSHEGALQEELQTTLVRMMENGEEAGHLNVNDLADALVAHGDKVFKLRKDLPVYKIPTGAGHALKSFYDQYAPTTNQFLRWADQSQDAFNFINLGLKGQRINNNAVSNIGFLALMGVTPFTPNGIGAIVDATRATMKRHLGVGGEYAEKLSGIFDLPGVRGGGLHSSDVAQSAATFAGKLAQRPLLRPITSAYGSLMRFNNWVEDFSRGVGAIYALRKQTPAALKEMGLATHNLSNLGERIDAMRGALVGATTPADVLKLTPKDLKAAVTEMERYMNNYDRASPLGTVWARRVFPYYKFYRHSAGLLMHYPFEAPIKATLFRGLAKTAQREIQDQLDMYGFDWKTMVPEHMRDSVPVRKDVGPDGQPMIVLANSRGPSPFTVLTGADPGLESLDLLHPLLKLGIERVTGVNLFRQEKFMGALSTHNGTVVGPDGAMTQDFNAPSSVSRYAQQFFPVQILRSLIAHGRIPMDTATTLDMALSRPEAFKRDKSGKLIRRPTYNYPLGALMPALTPAPQMLQAPTEAQAQATKGAISEELNNLLRYHPHLQPLVEGLIDYYESKGDAEPEHERVPYRE